MTVADARFAISSYCEGGACVGVARAVDAVSVMSTRTVGGPVLTFGIDEWGDFVEMIAHRSGFRPKQT